MVPSKQKHFLLWEMVCGRIEKAKHVIPRKTSHLLYYHFESVTEFIIHVRSERMMATANGREPGL